MALYTNTTRFASIVTLQIDVVEKPEAAVRIGINGAMEEFSAAPGHYDFVIGAGKEIHLINNTKATVRFVRSAP